MLLSGASLGTCVVSQVYLLLCSRHFFNEDPGHCGPACVCVSKCMAIIAVSNPESHSHSSLVNVIGSVLRFYGDGEGFCQLLLPYSKRDQFSQESYTKHH